jgi:hypothetical protein
MRLVVLLVQAGGADALADIVHSVSSWPEFAGHGAHGALRCPGSSTSCQVDAGQGTHADIPEARATLPKSERSLAHGVQRDSPALAEKVPGAQASETEALAAAE